MLPEAAARPTRVEVVLLALAILAGAALRLVGSSGICVEHFDEGVYTSYVWFGPEQGSQYPGGHLYAPPLLPQVLKWSIVVCGPQLGSMAVSLLAGCLTPLIVWAVGRLWLGSAAGLAAAVLAATSDLHLVYSRAALTESLLLFWWCLALLLMSDAFRAPRLRTALAAGLVASLAWWTKYNGWLPLAISATALAGWSLVRQDRRLKAPRLACCWLGMAATAAAVWSPVLWGLQSYGGYAAVAANHRNYAVGFAGWPSSFLQHAAIHRHFDSGVGCLGIGLAVLVAGAQLAWKGRSFMQGAQRGAVSSQHDDGAARQRCLLLLAPALILVASAAWIGASRVIAALAVAGCVLLLWDRRQTSDAEGLWTGLPRWLLLTWFAALLLATPMYRPYPRLALPWLASAWLAAGAAIQYLIRPSAGELGSTAGASRGPKLVVTGTAICLLAVLAALMKVPNLVEKGVPAWSPRTGLKNIAHQIADQARQIAPDGSLSGVIAYVYGEPALFFHLKAAGMPYVAPVQDLGFVSPQARPAPLPVLLITGPHADRSPEFARQWSDHQSRFVSIATYQYQASDLVLLNHYHPRQLVRSRPMQQVTLRRVR